MIIEDRKIFETSSKESEGMIIRELCNRLNNPIFSYPLSMLQVSKNYGGLHAQQHRPIIP